MMDGYTHMYGDENFWIMFMEEVVEFSYDE